MPNLTKFRETTRPVTFDYAGETITLTIYPDRETRELHNHILDVMDAEEADLKKQGIEREESERIMRRSYYLMAAILADWDITDTETVTDAVTGQQVEREFTLPIEVDSFYRLGDPLYTAMVQAVRESNSPNSQNGRPSPPSSMAAPRPRR